MEVRTRVLRDQLGVKLAKEANVDFDTPQIVAIESPPERRPGERPRTRSGGPRENRGPKRAMQGRPDREARGGESRFERDAAPRRAPPAPSTPERRRKHISALRAEMAADAATTRKRVERSATQDRKGRTIAVERMSRAVEVAHTPRVETRRNAQDGRTPGERGGRSSSGRTRREWRLRRPQARRSRRRAREAGAAAPEGRAASAREVKCREG
jgi:23S rRNA pseudouridine2605 synthase